MRSIVACLFVLLATTTRTTTAQEIPTLNLPQNSLNVTHRQSVCDRHDKYYTGELELRDVLQGLELHTLQRAGLYLNLDPETGAIDEEDPGLIADIMDELALRAGFTWRNSFGVTDGPAENRTWTDLLEWGVEAYDVSVDWWIHSSERLKVGIGFPAGFVDASYILISLDENDSDDGSSQLEKDLWSWTKPFSKNLWIAIALTVILTATIYAVLEAWETSSWEFGSSFFGSILVTLQHFQLHPKSHGATLMGLSLAFWSLVVTATYTANLASFFVIQNAPESPIQTIDDAVSGQVPMCVWEGVALHDFVLKKYPKGIYIPTQNANGAFEGLREGKCGLALVSVNEWKQAEINKIVNPDCNMEWIGRVINFQEAGFAVKSDSGRMCTSVIQDVLNLHLVDMESDGKMALLQEKFLKKTQDIDCVSINAAENNEDDTESGQLTLTELAGPFVVHCLATVCAILLTAGMMFQRKCFQKTNTDESKITPDDDESDLDQKVSKIGNDSNGDQKSSVEAQLQDLREKQDQILELLAVLSRDQRSKEMQGV